jgi:hypothetical protein
MLVAAVLASAFPVAKYFIGLFCLFNIRRFALIKNAHLLRLMNQ